MMGYVIFLAMGRLAQCAEYREKYFVHDALLLPVFFVAEATEGVLVQAMVSAAKTVWVSRWPWFTPLG